MTVFILTQVKLNSTRLPGKAMMLMNGKPMIQYQLEMLQQLKLAGNLVGVVSTNDPAEKPILDMCRCMKIPSFTDSPVGNTYVGYTSALKQMGACNKDIVIRITGDCPLLTKEDIEDALVVYDYQAKKNGMKYYYNGFQGRDVEVFDYTLFTEYSTVLEKRDRWNEHAPTYIRDTYPELCYYGKMTEIKLSVDTQEEFDKVSQLICCIGDTK